MASSREHELLRQQNVVAEFGENALRSSDFDHILHQACLLAGQALGTDLAKVMELQEDGHTLLVRAGVGWQPGVVGEVTVQANERSSEGHALRSREPTISTNIDTEERFEYPGFIREAGVKALVNVLIIGPEDMPPYGLLQVDSRTPREFSEEDTNFLRGFANLIAAAVDRFRTTADVERANESLRKSESRYRAIVESATEYAIITLDQDGRITGWNRGASAILGWQEADVLGQPLDMIFAPEDRDAGLPEDEMKQARATGYAIDERWHVRRDGSTFWASGQLTLLRDDGQHGYLKILRDQTEQRLTAERLQESETRLRCLAEGIPQLVWRSLSNGERIWGSPQWVEYSGLTRDESVRFGWLDALHPDDREAAMRAWEDAERLEDYSVEYRVRRVADGAYRWFQARALPVRGDNGQIIEWLGTSTDIDDQVRAREVLTRGRDELERLVAARTSDLADALASLRAETEERARAEDALRQSQKMEAVGQLTGGIAHDFNNILQGLGGSVELATRRIKSDRPSDALRFLDTARMAIGRAASLTHRLLAFARRQRLDPRPVDPDGLVAGMAEMIRRTMGPGITVDLHLRDGAWGVFCDPHELESALLNLCINARDAMPEGGTLNIGTGDIHFDPGEINEREEAGPGDFVVISVTDTGEGMSREVMARAFEPFYTTKLLGQGTGLGLSQVYGFVRQSRGIVQLESAPHQGTTVRLCLPRHNAGTLAAEPVLPPGPRQAKSGETVLLVDDEEDVRRTASEHLRELGYIVLEAEDAGSALRVLDTAERLDLLITDVGLPGGLNGRQLAETARQQRPDLPVLFITGYSGTTLAPGFEVIRKPFDLDTLARRVQAFVPVSDRSRRPA